MRIQQRVFINVTIDVSTSDMISHLYHHHHHHFVVGVQESPTFKEAGVKSQGRERSKAVVAMPRGM